MAIDSFKTEGKKLLVLGDSSTADIIKIAKAMGVYTIVSGIHPEAKTRLIADKSIVIPSDDHDTLALYIKENSIDGVMTGASEFQILNMIQLCEKVGLPIYVNEKQWNLCQNKATFKDLCRKFKVPVVPEYQVSAEMLPDELAKVEYPVVVKPVDACSSKGLSICKNEEDLKDAIPCAISASESGRFIVERCITSDYGFGCRYIANDGEIVLSALCDRYTVDEFDGKAHISSAAIFPSKMTDAFIRDINPQVIEMFKSIGIKNGTMFMQALVDQDTKKIYFHEMGLRLSGGLIYSMLEASCGYNDVKMMIRYALGGPMATEEEMTKIDPYMHGHFVGSITIPLKEGIIGKIEGVDDVRNNSNVTSLVQYYNVGDELDADAIGTLAQHFCRVKMMTSSKEEYFNLITKIQDTIKITNIDGQDMVYRKFEVDRLI